MERVEGEDYFLLPRRHEDVAVTKLPLYVCLEGFQNRAQRRKGAKKNDPASWEK